MATLLEIYNRVALVLGATQIQSLDEDRKLVELIDRHYQPVLKEVLRAYPYNFCTKQASLSSSNLSADQPIFGWDFAYDLPSDYVRLVEQEDKYPFIIRGTSLYTNIANPNFEYVWLQLDPTTYDELFCRAFANRMAFSFAADLTGSQAKTQECWAQYQDSLHEARLINARENDRQVDQGTGYWEEARR
jgi:hypothetical protein